MMNLSLHHKKAFGYASFFSDLTSSNVGKFAWKMSTKLKIIALRVWSTLLVMCKKLEYVFSIFSKIS